GGKGGWWSWDACAGRHFSCLVRGRFTDVVPTVLGWGTALRSRSELVILRSVSDEGSTSGEPVARWGYRRAEARSFAPLRMTAPVRVRTAGAAAMPVVYLDDRLGAGAPVASYRVRGVTSGAAAAPRRAAALPLPAPPVRLPA